MIFLQKYGGGTIVENTTYGIYRDVRFLKDAAEKTGVNIVSGTGEKLLSIISGIDIPQALDTTVKPVLSDIPREH